MTALSPRARIEAALAPLVGLPLSSATRPGGMASFQFGALRTAPSIIAGRPLRNVGDYALHVQCARRFTGIAGELDADGPPHYVSAIRVADNLVIEVAFASGFVLVIEPSGDGEHWRVFRPATDADHFVVTSDGIED